MVRAFFLEVLPTAQSWQTCRERCECVKSEERCVEKILSGANRCKKRRQQAGGRAGLHVFARETWSNLNFLGQVPIGIDGACLAQHCVASGGGG